MISYFFKKSIRTRQSWIMCSAIYLLLEWRKMRCLLPVFPMNFTSILQKECQIYVHRILSGEQRHSDNSRKLILLAISSSSRFVILHVYKRLIRSVNAQPFTQIECSKWCFDTDLWFASRILIDVSSSHTLSHALRTGTKINFVEQR